MIRGGRAEAQRGAGAFRGFGEVFFGRGRGGFGEGGLVFFFLVGFGVLEFWVEG